MPYENQEDPQLQNLTTEEIRSDRALYGRTEFSFSVDNHQFTGHISDNEINWMRPSPADILDLDKQTKIENNVRRLLSNGSTSNQAYGISMEEAFPDRTYKRRQVNLNIGGSQYRGFVEDGEIHWFQPHPTQKLPASEVEAIESTIQNETNDF